MVKDLKIEDFTYDLPEDKIAKHPLAQRDQSKFLVYKSGEIKDKTFTDISEELPKGAGLFMNNSKVIYARLNFFKTTGARIEVFCLEPANTDPGSAMMHTSKTEWICLIGNKKKWKGETLSMELPNGITLQATLNEEEEENCVCLSWNKEIAFAEVLEMAGKVPLPPYLNREAEDLDYDRYQTVYSRIEGSVAAPTAGLHFTERVLSSTKENDISLGEFTLHVGAGTFRPVKSKTIGEHDMHHEYAGVTLEALQQLKSLVENDKPIFCVGTTTLRTIESLYWAGIRALKSQSIDVEQWDPYQPNKGFKKLEIINGLIERASSSGGKLYFKTGIIIAPGYEFKFMNGLVTNFHQPNSTLLLLVAAIIGNDWKKVYEHALTNNYRFLSYGDSSLLWLD